MTPRQSWQCTRFWHSFLVVAHQHIRQRCLKEFPTEYLLGWLLITICSFLGLFFLSLYGSSLDHPTIAALCREPRNHIKSDGPKRYIAYHIKSQNSPIGFRLSMGILNHRWRRWFHSSVLLRGGLQIKRLTGAAVGEGVALEKFLTDFRWCPFRISHMGSATCCQVPKAVVASLGNRCITVDTGNLTSDTLQELIDTECPVDFTSTTLNHLIRLFSVDFGDEAAPGEVMKRLRYCNMMSLNLPGCSHLPAAAWKQLHGAKWLKLKKVDFTACLAEREMVAGVHCVFFTVCTEYCTSISPSSGSMSFFVEVVVWLDLGPTLQVLRRPRGGCCRSAWSSRQLAGARSVGIRWMSSDSGSRVAAAARCEVAKIKESQFQYVPRKREKWLKVFTSVLFTVCTAWVLYVQYLSRLEDFSQFRVNVIFLGSCCMTWPWTNTAGASVSKGRVLQICSKLSATRRSSKWRSSLYVLRSRQPRGTAFPAELGRSCGFHGASLMRKSGGFVRMKEAGPVVGTQFQEICKKAFWQLAIICLLIFWCVWYSPAFVGNCNTSIPHDFFSPLSTEI